MKRKQYNLTVMKNSINVESICNIMAKHNSLEKEYSMDKMETFLEGKSMEYGSLRNMKLFRIEDELIVMDDGEEVSLTIKLN